MTSELITANRVALSREAVEALARDRQEPSWLLDLRLRAFAAFERLPLPDQRTEGWRRTSLRGLPDLATLDVSRRVTGLRQGNLGGDTDNLPSEQVNGRVLPLEAAIRDADLGPRIERYFGRVVYPERDKFVALHYAFFNAGVVVVIPRGVVVDRPIWIEHDTGSGPLLTHTLILLEDEANASIVEDYRGDIGPVSGVVEQVLGANAHLKYAQLQRFGSDVWNFSTQRAELAQDASVRTLNVAIGSRMSRNTVQVLLYGARSQADLLGIAGGRDSQHIDFETLQDHVGDATRSDLVIHDALRERASANFTGLIRINKSAHQTESSQQQKNILLSEQARADSDPKLEILNNDVVRCTHGASVGPVDQEMIFYLESRGLTRTVAEQLIVEGFFRSVLRKLDLPSIDEAVWSAISERDQRADVATE